MALDHALAVELRPGEGVIRLYRWSPPTVSFGRNEPARDVYRRDAAASEGAHFVRRPTGGRAVLHDEEVTYAVCLPAGALGGPRETYVAINRGLVRGLRGAGLPASLAGAAPVQRPDAGPCFRAPGYGEVVLGGRKLVGSAQVRLGKSLLQHGSVILRGDQSPLDRLRGEQTSTAQPATVSEVLDGASWPDVADAVAVGLEVALGGTWRQGGYADAERERARRLVAERYATEEWTWRR